jgi:formyl-CoA transferase
MEGEVAPQVGNDHPTSMPTSAYQTADGYLNVGASGEGMWKRLCAALGREDLLKNDGFRDNKSRAKNRAELNRALNECFRKKTSAQWVEALNEAGVPCGPIYRIDEVFADPQVAHLEAAAPVTHAKLGSFRVVNQAIKLSRTPARVVAPTPDVGEHTDEILQELNYSAQEIAAMKQKGIV